MTPGPLEGLRVLDLTRLLPGGYATLLLADMGADVLKVEEPGKGDYIRWTPPIVGEFSASHIALNRNKRSMTLNLKSEEGRALFLELAGEHDVVIESFRPGVLERLGVGWSVLSERHPALIYCAITGYGQDGPRAQVAGHDANYIGYAGVLGIIGEEGRRPVVPGVQVGDLAGGGMAAVIAILAALERRRRTGLGDFCDVSMMDGAMSWLTIHAAAFVATGDEPERELMHLSGRYPCYRVYPAADGWLSVGALEPQFWAALVAALDRPDLADDAFATGARRDEVIGELEALFSKNTRAEWMQRLQGLDVCVGPVNGFGEALVDPQARARRMAFEADVPGAGEWTHIGDPLKFASSAVGDQPPSLRLPPPKMGEHTDEVLRSLGRSAADIETLRSSGAV
ncbi:MAG TPA: CaiB/BaiF CoA-transferase family protein [Actinomycetota bacterium]|nr:CaiB/BaiF CoA-transferase family protein [Actinomycetota bacterium]